MQKGCRVLQGRIEEFSETGSLQAQAATGGLQGVEKGTSRVRFELGNGEGKKKGRASRGGWGAGWRS